RNGKRFSIIAVAEGVRSKAEALQSSPPPSRKKADKAEKADKPEKADKADKPEKALVAKESNDEELHLVQEAVASRIARKLQQLTGTEARVTSLGHVQRGGEPTAHDRLLSTRLGTKAGTLLAEGVYDVMVAIQGGEALPVPLASVAGLKKLVPR